MKKHEEDMKQLEEDINELEEKEERSDVQQMNWEALPDVEIQPATEEIQLKKEELQSKSKGASSQMEEL
jgi:hypothetical protein